MNNYFSIQSRCFYSQMLLTGINIALLGSKQGNLANESILALAFIHRKENMHCMSI